MWVLPELLHIVSDPLSLEGSFKPIAVQADYAYSLLKAPFSIASDYTSDSCRFYYSLKNRNLHRQVVYNLTQNQQTDSY